MFKELSLAFWNINLYIADYSDHHHTAAKDSSNINKYDDWDFLSMLQKENILSLNQMSITLGRDRDQAGAWIAVLEKKFEYMIKWVSF